MESLINYIKKFPYLFVILIGILFIMSAIFKWNWLLNNNSSNFMITIYEIFGEMGVRIITGILGIIIIISSIIIWIIKK
ncbi:Imm17 family immunity protein [Brachyspira hyodysenteriae]|uniref:Imm17 family immunity protein n=1 Tax=Brachyspira hyodysenteriae TaxID=159 RepID=UPI002B262C3B|nr:Imm17 family immunity protein [Brachyspira hyodysenteriae]WPC22916.1 Imm17 family immunity protein [Brachyspira hyodysenteriae]